MNGQVSKPKRIFDRAHEWDGLVGFATSDSPDVRLGIVSGRRRQGKTYLLDAAATTFGGFFFTATDSTEAESLAGFAGPWPARARPVEADTRSRIGTRRYSGCSER